MDLSGRVVVAMSGGVDSSVSAYLLAQQGYDCVGVSMQVWDYRKNGGCSSKATCCSPDDFTDARQVAATIGIPYYVFDFEESFRKEVIDTFVQKYQSGLTPNPCIDCNNKVKFRDLRERAFRLGCTHVATGHFARVRESESGYHLLRGLDSEKDQSYFLYGMPQSELKRTLFPVGEMTKTEVREIANRAGLVTAQKPESQDICFIQGNVQDFIARQGGSCPPGRIRTQTGEILGSHDGIHRFTVGQRKGLGIGGRAHPLYVLELDAKDNCVYVGEKNELEREGFLVDNVHWVSPLMEQKSSEGGLTFEAIAQMRHRHRGVPVRVTAQDGAQQAKVEFLQEWSTVSPGQAAVFYDLKNEELLGGGRVSPIEIGEELQNFQSANV